MCLSYDNLTLTRGFQRYGAECAVKSALAQQIDVSMDVRIASTSIDILLHLGQWPMGILRLLSVGDLPSGMSDDFSYNPTTFFFQKLSSFSYLNTLLDHSLTYDFHCAMVISRMWPLLQTVCVPGILPLRYPPSQSL